MTLDAIASERHFLDHLAPIWAVLPHSARGRFLVDPSLVDRAAAKGIDAEPFDMERVRKTPQRPPNRNGHPALVASIGDIKIGRRLDYGPFAFLEHGAGQAYDRGPRANPSYAGGPDREDNELFLVPSEYCARLWREAYPNARVEIVGCPKLDELPAREGGGPPVVALSFHWPAPLGVSGYAGTALGDFLPALPDLAKRFSVIGHAHPKADWPQRMKRTYERAGIPFVADFEDVCRQADVFVADNTSTLFEFAATGRPVVLMNATTWAKARGKDPNPPGLRFWDAAPVGINVDRWQDLGDAIEEALADAPVRRAAREAALAFVYGVRSGGAVLAARAVMEWLESKVEVAA